MYLRIDQLKYNKVGYSDSLKSSLERQGLAFPLSIKYMDGQYRVSDGHKRCSVLEDIGYKNLIACELINEIKKNI